MAGRDRFFFPPPSTPTDYDSFVDKVEAVAGALATQDDLNAALERLADARSEVRALQGVQGWGSRYMSRQFSPGSSFSTVPFDRQEGPMQGVHTSGGEYVLESRGLWRADAQCFFDVLLFANSSIFMDIVVLTPTGSVFRRRRSRAAGSEQQTISNMASFVAPEAGYRVRVEARVGADWRGMLPGRDYTAFDITKVSSETGPGGVLAQRYMATDEWTPIRPMTASGGGIVHDEQAVIAQATEQSVRVEGLVFSDFPCQARLVANGQIVATSAALRSDHQLVSTGGVTSGDRFTVEVRGAGVVILPTETKLTIMSM